MSARLKRRSRDTACKWMIWPLPRLRTAKPERSSRKTSTTRTCQSTVTGPGDAYNVAIPCMLLVHERVAAIAQSNPLQADLEKKKVSSATVDNEARMADAVVQTLKKFFGD